MLMLRELREANGYEVKDMCRLLHVNDSRYRKWESGTNGLPLEYAFACCDLFHCTLDELSGRRAVECDSDERRLVNLYRKCNEKGRECLLQMAETTAALLGS